MTRAAASSSRSCTRGACRIPTIRRITVRPSHLPRSPRERRVSQQPAGRTSPRRARGPGDEVRQTVVDLRRSARAAIEAGADGVEIHGANSYLIQQFIAPSANARTDEYGGSIVNRARFAIDVATAIAGEIGA